MTSVTPSKKKTGLPKTHPQPQLTSKTLGDYLIWGGKNLIFGGLFAIVTFQIIEKTPGYNWVYNTLLKENHTLIQANKHLSLDSRWEAKVGLDYSYMKHIRDNTPNNAIILYPDAKMFSAPKGPSFSADISNKTRLARFVHPRKIVLFSEIGTSSYAAKATHVAIINRHGNEYLKYNPGFILESGVLPIDSTSKK